MKKFPFIVVIIIILFAQTVALGEFMTCDQCDKADDRVKSQLRITVVQEPTSGQNVSTVTCKYEVEYDVHGSKGVNDSGETYWENDNGDPAVAPTPLTLTLYWVNDKGGKYDEEEITFGPGPNDTKSGTFTTTKSASQGMVLDKTFWVVFKWYDDISGNNFNEKNSAKAVCTVK